MADTIELSSGSGGATLRVYQDAAGNDWTPAVIVYATATTDGAAVIQPVQVGNGLPVVQDGTWTVLPGDTPNTTPWLMSISEGGNTAAVSAGGALSVEGTITVGAITSITDPVTVISGTAGNFLCTASQGGSWTVAATQSGSWNVGTVSTVTAVTDITNPVTVISGTPGNLLATVNIASAQTLATVTTVGTVTSVTNPVTVAQATPGNLLATVNIASAQTLATVTNVGTVGTITNAVTVAQATPGNLLATVNIASAQTLATVTTVGTVTTVTNPVTVAQATAGNLNCTAVIAAGTALVGKVSASAETNTIYNGTTALTPKFAKITASSSGNTSVVPLVSTKKIRVIRWGVSCNGAVNIKFQSNTTDLTGLHYNTQYSSCGGGTCQFGHFETAAGEALNINLSASVSVGGELTYVEV